jgi:hypothetical protein
MHSFEPIFPGLVAPIRKPLGWPKLPTHVGFLRLFRVQNSAHHSRPEYSFLIGDIYRRVEHHCLIPSPSFN